MAMQIEGWQKADEVAHRLQLMARGLNTLPKEKLSSVCTIRREGNSILIENNGSVFALVPLEAMLQISNGMLGLIRLIEEEDKAEAIAFDQALLTRTGALPGMGLTSNLDILDLARIEAGHNTELRKARPFGVRYQGNIGHVQLKQGDPN